MEVWEKKRNGNWDDIGEVRGYPFKRPYRGYIGLYDPLNRLCGLGCAVQGLTGSGV